MSVSRDRQAASTPGVNRASAAWRCWCAAVLAGLALGAAAAPADELATAQTAMADGLYDVAERHLTRYLVQNRARPPEESVPALAWLCQVLAQQGRPADLLHILSGHPEIVAAGRADGVFDFWKARALLDLGRGQELLKQFRDLSDVTLREPYATGLRRLAARAQMAVGDASGARATFAQVDRLATNRLVKAENLLEWAQAELDAGDAAAAEALLRRQAELAVTNLPLPAVSLGSLLQAQLLRAGGREAEAERLLGRLANDPAAPPDSRAEAWIELAAIAAAQGETNAVRQAGFQALERGDLPPRHAWRLALRYGRLLVAFPGLVPEGAELLKRCIREQPGGPGAAAAQKALADGWLAAGSNTQAVAEYRNYLETYGEADQVSPALRGLALALLRLGNPGESATTFLKAAQATTNPVDQATCLLKAADACHADRRYEQAAGLYTQVANMGDPARTAPAAFMAADALERLGRTEAAETAFARLAASGAVGVAGESRLRLALLYERREAVGDALRTYSQVIDESTNDVPRAAALLGRGRTHYRSYQFDAAVADLARVREIAPPLADEAAYLQMLALYGAGRDEEAARLGEAYPALHAASPRLPEAALWLAQFAYNRKAYEEAQQRFTTFAARWPRHALADAALVLAARAAVRRAEFPAGIELLARLPRDYPESGHLAEARYLQADALCEMARFEEAVLVFDEIVNRYPESVWVTPAWLRKGDSLLALGSSTTNRYDEALRAYAVVLARPDADTAARLQAAFKRGRCLEKMGRVDEALDHYYDQVMLRFLRDQQAGMKLDTEAQAWFARAAMQAAAVMEAQGRPEAAVRVLQRLIGSRVPGAAEAQTILERIEGDARWRWQPARWTEGGGEKQP